MPLSNAIGNKQARLYRGQFARGGEAFRRFARVTPLGVRRAGLAVHGLTIHDPGCVSKTFPDFFDHWRRLAGGK